MKKSSQAILFQYVFDLTVRFFLVITDDGRFYFSIKTSCNNVCGASSRFWLLRGRYIHSDVIVKRRRVSLIDKRRTEWQFLSQFLLVLVKCQLIAMQYLFKHVVTLPTGSTRDRKALFHRYGIYPDLEGVGATMHDKKEFLLDYIKKNGQIFNKDMNDIKHLTKMNLPEQMKFLKSLENERKIENRTTNDWEPAFYLFDAQKASIDRAMTAQNDYKLRGMKAKILQYLHRNRGVYNEFDFFLDFGVAVDVQQKCLRALIEEGKIRKTAKGFEIVKETIPY